MVSIMPEYLILYNNTYAHNAKLPNLMLYKNHNVQYDFATPGCTTIMMYSNKLIHLQLHNIDTNYYAIILTFVQQTNGQHRATILTDVQQY